jgi:hypothetical protein
VLGAAANGLPAGSGGFSRTDSGRSLQHKRVADRCGGAGRRVCVKAAATRWRCPVHPVIESGLNQGSASDRDGTRAVSRQTSHSAGGRDQEGRSKRSATDGERPGAVITLLAFELPRRGAQMERRSLRCAGFPRTFAVVIGRELEPKRCETARTRRSSAASRCGTVT